MDTADNRIEIERGPDGDRVTVNGVLIPGASLMFQDARRIVISIPAAEVKTTIQARPSQARRIALGEDENEHEH